MSVGGMPIMCNKKLTGLRWRSSQFTTSRDGVRGGQIIGMGSTVPADEGSLRIQNKKQKAMDKGQKAEGNGQRAEHKSGARDRSGAWLLNCSLSFALCPE